MKNKLTASQKYRLKNKDTEEYKRRAIESQKKWREKNLDKARKLCRDYYSRNREIILNEKKRYFQEIKAAGYSEKRRLNQRVNCHLRRMATYCDKPLSVPEWIKILECSGSKCVRCGSSKDLTIDHIIPIIKGGKHTADNVQVLCRSCNSSKGDR